MDEIVMSHRHGRDLCAMAVVGVDRVDHLSVKRYRCECGLSRAILEHVQEQPAQSLAPWPYPHGAGTDGDEPEARIVG